MHLYFAAFSVLRLVLSVQHEFFFHRAWSRQGPKEVMAEVPERLEAEGVGSRETVVGTGADDASDVLDRRVEFEPRSCPAVAGIGRGTRG